MQSWDESLEKAAQLQTDSCYLKKELATNIYYNDSELTGESTTSIMTTIVDKWLGSSVQQVGSFILLYYSSYKISGYIYINLFSFSLYYGIRPWPWDVALLCAGGYHSTPMISLSGIHTLLLANICRAILYPVMNHLCIQQDDVETALVQIVQCASLTLVK